MESMAIQAEAWIEVEMRRSSFGRGGGAIKLSDEMLFSRSMVWWHWQLKTLPRGSNVESWGPKTLPSL